MAPQPKFAGAALLILAVFCRCSGLYPGSADNDFKYLPLKEYTYEPAEIRPGTEINIVAFSGGRENDKDADYYPQFIVINTSNGDTVRILTPLISTDSSAGSTSKTYTSPMQFDGSRGIRSATYETANPHQRMMMRLTSESIFHLPEGAEGIKELNSLIGDTIGKKEYVVINNAAPIFERKYKTIIGVLNFKDPPWWPQPQTKPGDR